MAAFNKFNQFVEDLAKKVHNLGLASDVLKVALSDVAPTSANAVFANITEISAGNGYTAGGGTLTISASAQSSGTYKLTINDFVFTASGGSIGPFRYVVVYNSTPTSPLKPLIGWYDYGAELTITNGNTFTVDFDNTNGVLTIA